MEKLVDTTLGKILGIENEKGFRFLGIPFAKPPLGELMFARPQKPDKWSGVYKADTPKANPIQRKGTFSVGNNSLDCLYLNIYVPKSINDSTKKLPVMVWIYGGSFATGGSGLKIEGTNQIEYDCSDFANETNCILVTFNYRLNLYGYSNLEFLGDKFDYNNGIRDQILALEFVKENIENFGGNSNNITIFGQSAGGASVLYLMCIKECEHLFNKAIAMSPVSEHYFAKEESAKIAKRYLKYLGISKNNYMDLYNLKPEIIVEANKQIGNYLYRKGELRCPFSPTIDGELLVDEPMKLIQKSTKQLVIGNVINEGNLFLLDIPDFVLPFMVKIFKLKPRKGKESYRYRASIALTHHIYLDPLLKILSTYKGKAYRYQYRYVSPTCEDLGVETFHACDVPVLFDYNTHFESVDDKETKRVGKEMRKLFSDFAKDKFDEYSEYKNDENNLIIIK